MGDEDVTSRSRPTSAPTYPAPSSTGGAPRSEEAPPRVAGYDLVRILGRGGMGIVWEAFEHRFDRAVAIKVHLEAITADPHELWKEAFVAAKIGDPSIVRVLDVGSTLDGQPYYAMELVDGVDLGTILREGPMPARRAMAIAADVARAASAAHANGVIHRDFKPRNVILDETGRARVVDFGIAFDAKTGKDRFAGTIAGSPRYMAPEQVLGFAITPQTDIFAIGIMLYEMLCGQRPFAGSNMTELLEAIVRAQTVPPSTHREGIHRDVDAIVMRCLAPEPKDRFASARALFEALSAVVEGTAIDVAPPSVRTPEYAPKPVARVAKRARREDAKKHLSWSWKLASSADALWPYVANTDRFNKCVGLGPVDFSDDARSGATRVLGMNIRWHEHPFEWVKDRVHSVYREYESGPLVALWNEVTLTALPSGGTELRHDIWTTPRGLVGPIATFLEIEVKLGAAFDKFYTKLDRLLSAKTPEDPFEPRHRATRAEADAVEEACRSLRAQGFSERLVERLAYHLLSSPTGALAALRPFELADQWGENRNETLDAFVHAARAGVVEPSWDVICPRCRIAHESHAALGLVTQMGVCHACAAEFVRDLRDSVELVFVPHPSVRRIERETYCAGSPARRPHVVAQQVLAPGEERKITVAIERGAYSITTAGVRAPAELVASAVGFEKACRVHVHDARVEARPTVVRDGDTELSFTNATGEEQIVRVELAAGRDDRVSATAALTHPTFSAHFGDHLLAVGERLGVSQLAFVFVRMFDRAQVFERLGDSGALGELSRLDERVRAEARKEEGVFIPSSLDVLVVAFASPLRALRAALALRTSFDASPLVRPVAIAVNAGRCIALTRDGKTEYSGETMQRGFALLDDCPEGAVALSRAFVADRVVALAVYEAGFETNVKLPTKGPNANRRIAIAQRAT